MANFEYFSSIEVINKFQNELNMIDITQKTRMATFSFVSVEVEFSGQFLFKLTCYIQCMNRL